LPAEHLKDGKFYISIAGLHHVYRSLHTPRVLSASFRRFLRLLSWFLPICRPWSSNCTLHVSRSKSVDKQKTANSHAVLFKVWILLSVSIFQHAIDRKHLLRNPSQAFFFQEQKTSLATTISKLFTYLSRMRKPPRSAKPNWMSVPLPLKEQQAVKLPSPLLLSYQQPRPRLLPSRHATSPIVALCST